MEREPGLYIPSQKWLQHDKGNKYPVELRNNTTKCSHATGRVSASKVLQMCWHCTTLFPKATPPTVFTAEHLPRCFSSCSNHRHMHRFSMESRQGAWQQPRQSYHWAPAGSEEMEFWDGALHSKLRSRPVVELAWLRRQGWFQGRTSTSWSFPRALPCSIV